MIFNTDEVIKVLNKICFKDLTHDERQVIRTLIIYLDNQEPKLTYDEFVELFDCKTEYVDMETLEIKVTPKQKFYLHIDKSIGSRAYNSIMGINPKLKEHLYNAAYSEFMETVRSLKNE